MRFAIYDKSEDGYLSKMELDLDTPETALGLSCGYNEYITDAQLLDTKKAATDVIARINGFKFMEEGRFVIHSFDETLGDQYIISEAGNPTKVVDDITVNLDGTINVKYGTMACHWSTVSLIYVINKLNKLQDASAPTRYCSWNATFDIYKVVTVIDENGHNHYQFINVTDKGIVSAKKEANSITKRIEELEEEKDNLEAKIESIKREARNWKNLYENASDEREELKNAIDIIRSDLLSTTACDDLKDTLNALKSNSGLDRISMDNFLTAKDEIRSIVNKMIRLMESRELTKNDDTSAENASKYNTAIANDIINICEADDKFDITLKKFSELYEAVNDPSDDDDTIMYAFKGVLEILSSIEDHVRNIIDDGVYWKNRAMTAEKAKDNQKKLNEANVASVVRYRNKTMDMNKEIKELRTMRDCLAGIIRAIRNAICDNNSGAFDCIESRMIHDSDFNSSPFMVGVRENIKDICIAEKKLNYVDTDIITQMDDKLRDMVKESNRFHDNRNRLVSVIYDIRNAIYNKDSDALCCINDSIIHDADFNADLAMESAGGNLRDICNACYINITNNELKNSEIAKAADALEEANDQNERLANMLKEITDCIAGIMVATNTPNTDKMISNLRDVSRKIGVKTIDDGPMYGLSIILSTLIINAKAKSDWKSRAEEAISDYIKCSEALGELLKRKRKKDSDYEMLTNKLKACEVILESTQNSLTIMTEERDKALELKDFYKRQVNSVYGMTMPCRSNGKQGWRDMLYDVTTGIKIPIDKEKYDDLVECVNNINTTYEILKRADFTMDKPSWFDGIVKRIKNLT